MPEPLALGTARILVTNDDGIHAPGLKALERIAKSLSKDVWVVAPESEQSATSHSLTLRRPVRPRKLGPRRYALDGTPTDCVLIAQRHILEDRPADLVLSGVNHGANLGEDVTYSGTVAAAMEGALLGTMAIAFSQVRRRDQRISWSTSETFGPPVVRKLVASAWPADLLVNVNFPPCLPKEVSGIEVCPQGRRQAGTEVREDRDPSGRRYLWIGDFTHDRTGETRSDLAAVERNAVAVTPLHLDLTHGATLKSWKGTFA
jgi:5'-nucleotidase